MITQTHEHIILEGETPILAVFYKTATSFNDLERPAPKDVPACLVLLNQAYFMGFLRGVSV